MALCYQYIGNIAKIEKFYESASKLNPAFDEQYGYLRSFYKEDYKGPEKKPEGSQEIKANLVKEE